MLPDSAESRAAMFRTLVSDRRMLIVLDNARTAAQVRPLLPGAGNCFVLITSRDSLTSLVVRDDAYRIDLDAFDMADSIDLIKRTLAQSAHDGDEEILMNLADLCGRLPLALRIATERISSDRSYSLEDLVESLSMERDRLDILATPDNDSTTAMKSVFDWSYKALPIEIARIFRICSLHPGPHFNVGAAAALSGVSVREVERSLEALISASLLERNGYAKTYHFHDLVRIFAQHCLMKDETAADLGESRRRECLWYVNATDAANRKLSPHRTPIDLRGLPSAVPVEGISTFEDALRWFEFERLNLMGVLKCAELSEMFDVVWKMATAAWSYYDLRKYLPDWIDSHELGLNCARRIGDVRGECRVRDNLGIAYREAGRLEDAAECLERALEQWRSTGFTYGEAATLDNLGCVYLEVGDLDRAQGYLESAILLNRRIDDRWGEARVMNNIGRVFLKRSNGEEAELRFAESASVYRQLNDIVGEARVVSNWGRALTLVQDHERAAAKFSYSLGLQRRVGDRHGEAETLRCFAELSMQQGDIPYAMEQLKQSMIIFRELGDPQEETIRRRLDELIGMYSSSVQ